MNLQVIWEYRYLIVFFVGIIIFALFERQRTKVILYALMLQAKRYAKDYILKSGKEQEDWVVKKAMLFLPFYVKLFVNEAIVRIMVKNLYNTMKDYLDDGKLNGSH